LGNKLELMLENNDAELSSKLDAMVASRKKIAHGDGETVTTAKALAWQVAAETIGLWLIDRFDPR